MRMKPHFRHWMTCTDRMGLTDRESSDAEYYSAAGRMLNAVSMASGFNHAIENGWTHVACQAERLWHKWGRPYFKVWPQIAESLEHTTMNFSAEHLKTPYSVFSVMLPDRSDKLMTFLVSAMPADRLDTCESQAEHWKSMLRRGVKSTTQRSAILANIKDLENKQDYINTRVAKFGPLIMQLVFSFLDADGEIAFTYFYVHANTTIEDGLVELRDDLHNETPDRPWISWDYTEVLNLIRIGIAVSMFGVDRHELVAPDINREVLHARFPGGRSKGSQQIAAAAIEREIAKCKGWRVGSEIDLPRQIVERGEVREGAGTELHFGHYRSGHMRMQPCGHAGKERKLIFVAPTLVRPDLPIRQSHGYRIRGATKP